ncbi:MAG: MerR family transcriptional regulator [Chloroflexota bacterium]|nr:MerR family transcriptional regulator [Chloroflexota bacterium]
MTDAFTIGDVAQRAGLPAKTIRFYEEQGIIPPPARTEGGYRVYGPTDLRRLRLVRQATKLLGLPLPEVKTLVEQAFSSSCADFADQFLARISAQRTEIDRRIGELAHLKADLDTLAEHVAHSREALLPGQTVAGCDYCPILDIDAADTSPSGDGHAPVPAL